MLAILLTLNHVINLSETLPSKDISKPNLRKPKCAK